MLHLYIDTVYVSKLLRMDNVAIATHQFSRLNSSYGSRISFTATTNPDFIVLYLNARASSWDTVTLITTETQNFLDIIVSVATVECLTI